MKLCWVRVQKCWVQAAIAMRKIVFCTPINCSCTHWSTIFVLPFLELLKIHLGINENGNCFLHHITAPDSSEKDETILKKNFRNMCSGFFFPERNFILRIFLSGISFSFLFPDFYFRNTIISFPNFFFQNVLFINSGFFCPE